MSETDPQFLLIKDTLEDMDLYLKEIEQTLDILESEPGEKVRGECEIKLVQLQQHLAGIYETLVTQNYARAKRKLL